MTAYKAIDGQDNYKQEQQTMSHKLIEHVVKNKYKSHRSAADFDSKYISDIVATMQSIWVFCVVVENNEQTVVRVIFCFTENNLCSTDLPFKFVVDETTRHTFVIKRNRKSIWVDKWQLF